MDLREEELKNRFEAAPGLYLMLTPALVVVGVTDAYLATTNTRREDIIGRSLFEVFPDLGRRDPLPSGASQVEATELPRILVVDDSAEMRVYLTHILSRHWIVETQPDGLAAWSSIAARPPALVISDVFMPGLDGLGLSARMRADPRTAELPMILISVRTGEDATIDGLDAGAVDYLEKPFSPRELVARVRARLELSCLRRRLKQAEILSEERVQAQRMDAMGKLAGEIARDFNNLLTVINGVTDLALAGPQLTPELRDQLRDVRSCGERAATLSRQLLAYSSKQILRLEPVHVNRVLADLDELHRDAGDSIEVHLELTPAPDLIRADRGQLEHVIRNLVANARAAMPAGGSLTIRTAREGSHVQLSVTDTGIGMDAETRVHLFEPFQVTRPAGRNAGLGLAAVHGIVSQCDGRIRVESQPGAGTTIELSFPALPGDATEEPRPAPRAPGTPRTRTVLIAEDDAGVRKFIAGVLAPHGYTLLHASNGEDALATAASHPAPIDVLVTDALMPRMSGHQLTRELRTIRPELKVLIVSGHADGILSEHLRDDPSTRFLAKPFTPHALAEQVQLLLGSKEEEVP